MSSVAVSPRVPKPILTEGFLNDPYPVYRRFLEEGPFHFVGMGPGFHAAFSYPLASCCCLAGMKPRGI